MSASYTYSSDCVFSCLSASFVKLVESQKACCIGKEELWEINHYYDHLCCWEWAVFNVYCNYGWRIKIPLVSLFISPLLATGLPFSGPAVQGEIVLYSSQSCRQVPYCYPGASLAWRCRKGAFYDLPVKSFIWPVYWGCGLHRCFRLTSIDVTFPLCCLLWLQSS